MKSVIGQDINILELMYPDEYSMTSWSAPFLNESSKIIKLIHETNFNTKILSESHRELGGVSGNLIWDSFNTLFSHFNEYEQLINSFLTMNNIVILNDIIERRLINTLDDFHYIITHLPFHREICSMIQSYIERYVDIDPIYKKYVMGSFISPIIQSWIFDNDKYLSTYQLMSPDGQLVSVQIVSSKTFKTPKIIQQICDINEMLKYLYHVHNKSPLHVIYVVTPFIKKTKYFEPNQPVNEQLVKLLRKYTNLEYNYIKFTNPISTINVNSGVSVKGEETFITIWRAEEFQKILIHELIHFYDLEKGTNFQHIHVNVSNNYPMYSKELFTELQAWYIYIMYVISLTKNTYNPRDIQFILDYERTYSMINVYKFFHHFGINNVDQFLSTIDKYTINQGSSILYYYIFKAVILFSTDKIIECLLLPQCSNVSTCSLTRHIRDKIETVLKSVRFRNYFKFISEKYLGDLNHLQMMSIKMV